MKENNNLLESRGVSLTQKQWARCDRLAEEKGCKSRNAFIREAVDFYCAWLEKEHIEKFLLPSLESVIGAKVRDSEERICRLLFKLAVDQNYLAKIRLSKNINFIKELQSFLLIFFPYFLLSMIVYHGTYFQNWLIPK